MMMKFAPSVLNLLKASRMAGKLEVKDTKFCLGIRLYFVWVFKGHLLWEPPFNENKEDPHYLLSFIFHKENYINFVAL